MSRRSSPTRALLGAGLAAWLALTLSAGPAAATAKWAPWLTQAHGGWHEGAYPRITGDINGDGLDDIVGFGHAGVHVGLSTGVGFTTAGVVLGNFNLGYGWQVDHHPRRIGDFDGDGRDDVIGFGHEAAYVALSHGAGLHAPQPWIHDYDILRGWTTLYHDRAIGDVDGDGRDDIVGFGDHAVLVARSMGHRFTGQEVWSHELVRGDGFVSTHHSRQLGDVDGDGRADVIAFTHWGVVVMRSTGHGFEPSRFALPDFGTAQRGTIAEAPRRVGDVDGDGRDDVVAFTAGGVLVARSNGWSFDPPTLWLDDFGAQTGWGPQHARMLADVDGDGRADLVGFHDAAVRVALSRGGRFVADFDPLSSGDFVTRLEQVAKGMCLSTHGADPIQRSCDAGAPVGWVLRARGDGTYDVMQDGKCLHAPYHGAVDSVWANPVACGNVDSAWYVERDREGRMRLRNTWNGGCLQVPGATRGEGERARVMPCSASDHQLFRARTLRPRSVVTPLKVRHSSKCLHVEGDARITQRPCDGGDRQRYTMVDNGHGQVRFYSHGMPGRCIAISSTQRGWGVNAMPCIDGSPWEHFALQDVADGQRLLVSQLSGHCLDIQGSGPWDGTALLSWDCHGGQNQQFTMPTLQAPVPMEISLQDVGRPEGTALFIAHRTGGLRTRDPVAIVAFARQAGLVTGQAALEALLTAPQQAEFTARVGAWDAPLPEPLAVQAEVLSVSADYSVGLEGVDLGVQAAAASGTVEIGGVVHGEVKVLTTDARLTLRDDGFAFGPSADVIAGEAGFGDPDGSYAGVAGGLGSRGFSVAARWGQSGQYGVTVPLAVVSVDLYISGGDAITAASFANDVGAWMTFAAIDGFQSAHGWSAAAYNHAVGAINGFLGGVGDVVGAIAGGFCGVFGC